MILFWLMKIYTGLAKLQKLQTRSLTKVYILSERESIDYSTVHTETTTKTKHESMRAHTHHFLLRLCMGFTSS
jgi:hypothetical protein